jgi:hypothetical protein
MERSSIQSPFVVTVWRSPGELLELRRWFFDRGDGVDGVDGRRRGVDKVCILSFRFWLK